MDLLSSSLIYLVSSGQPELFTKTLVGSGRESDSILPWTLPLDGGTAPSPYPAPFAGVVAQVCNPHPWEVSVAHSHSLLHCKMRLVWAK